MGNSATGSRLGPVLETIMRVRHNATISGQVYRHIQVQAGEFIICIKFRVQINRARDCDIVWTVFQARFRGRPLAFPHLFCGRSQNNSAISTIREVIYDLFCWNGSDNTSLAFLILQYKMATLEILRSAIITTRL